MSHGAFVGLVMTLARAGRLRRPRLSLCCPDLYGPADLLLGVNGLGAGPARRGQVVIPRSQELLRGNAAFLEILEGRLGDHLSSSSSGGALPR